MKAYVIVKTTNKYNEKEIFSLRSHFNIKAPKGVKLNKSDEIILLNKEVKSEYIQEMMDKECGTGEQDLNSFEIVLKPSARWISGEYYAGEYSEYVSGRARLIKWTDYHQEVEVECLDKSKIVSDNPWDLCQSGTISNGCGDKFYPDKPIK